MKGALATLTVDLPSLAVSRCSEGVSSGEPIKLCNWINRNNAGVIGSAQWLAGEPIIPHAHSEQQIYIFTLCTVFSKGQFYLRICKKACIKRNFVKKNRIWTIVSCYFDVSALYD